MKYLIALPLLLIPIAAHGAENPRLIVTWKARSYTPLSYIGKALPIAGTPIDLTVTLFNKNRAVSLTGTEVRWYQEGQLAARGPGRTSFSLTAPRTGQDILQIRVSIPNYKGQTLDQFADIPLVRPEAVVDQAALPKLSSLFYFFSITHPSSLITEWNDNGESISLQVSNKNNPLEFARTQITKP